MSHPFTSAGCLPTLAGDGDIDKGDQRRTGRLPGRADFGLRWRTACGVLPWPGRSAVELGSAVERPGRAPAVPGLRPAGVRGLAVPAQCPAWSGEHRRGRIADLGGGPIDVVGLY